ncbi:MAG: alpha/beta fold hydrolase [Rhodospirillaceae bacterium]|nr:alpha/beta fold hydrolase [Rhodospirillaceae bacterium]
MRNSIVGGAPDLSSYVKERIKISANDGSGDVLQAAVNRPYQASTKPMVILIHGLTGCEDSYHILVTANALLELGHPVLRLNLRGAGPSRMTCRGHYHSGLSADLSTVIDYLCSHKKAEQILLMGFSLGGNLLLKCLAEHGGDRRIRAAVAVCPPVDLKIAQQRIMSRRNWLYHRYLLSRMKSGVQGSDLVKGTNLEWLQSIRTVYDFDNTVVAPNNGFTNAEDYYFRSSSLPLLDAIEVPTLIIHPQDDPWVPTQPIIDRNWSRATAITLLSPRFGGHIGSHGVGDKIPWYVDCAVRFFQHHKT